MKKVSEVMTRDVITVGPGASIHEAARLLNYRAIHRALDKETA